MSTIVEFSKLINEIRLNSGLSVQKLAAKSGVSRSAIYKIEKNPNATPSIEIVKTLVQATKPTGDQSAWIRHSLRLIFDEATALSIEKALKERDIEKPASPTVAVVQVIEKEPEEALKVEKSNLFDKIKSKIRRLR